MDHTFETSTPMEPSPGIAPNAKYVKHGSDYSGEDLRLTDTDLAFLEQIRRIDFDMHCQEKGNISQMWPWASARIGRIAWFVERVSATCDSGFVGRLDGHGRILELIETSLGRFYYDVNVLNGKVLDAELGLTLDHYRVPPSVQLFFDVYERHAIGQYGPQYFTPHPANYTPDCKRFLWQSFNELIEMIREGAVAYGLDKMRIANTLRPTRAFNSMMKVVNRCFTKHRRIFVICMDVFYRVEWADKVSVGLAKCHHADFVNRLRGLAKIRGNLIGAIWKLDWAESKGHYFRWILMFDGDSVHATWEYEELVDRLWKEVVPKNAGETHLLNDAEHTKAGTGMIDLDESFGKFDIFVESIIRYFAQKDQMLSIKREPGTRTWDWLMPGH
ncbi:inovirus-type Gp2 protein [Paraburkholderia kururiensis]|uniref:inovirus-type Gp2 protein n=1 Tax=Paraburkholderia kururiensis TaxID=984307 RepID=UPI0014707244|nr:inovirus-type Gp2 protein [Paraburkholderia kururiensis]